jgi:hypothetical protein
MGRQHKDIGRMQIGFNIIDQAGEMLLPGSARVADQLLQPRPVIPQAGILKVLAWPDKYQVHTGHAFEHAIPGFQQQVTPLAGHHGAHGGHHQFPPGNTQCFPYLHEILPILSRVEALQVHAVADDLDTACDPPSPASTRASWRC